MSIGSKGEKTRADIVGCANRLFYEQGYEAASFSDIVDASGLYRGNIYHYFKSKEDILRAVVEQRLEEFRTLLTQWDKAHTNPKARLLAFVDMITGRTRFMKNVLPEPYSPMKRRKAEPPSAM